MSLMHPRVAHNYAKRGFYPTDDETTQRAIRALVPASGLKIKIFDPCCGEGVALRNCKEQLSTLENDVESFGIEINEENAWKAKDLLNYCIKSDINDCVISPKQFGLLWLNPPYGDLAKDHTNITRDIHSGRRRLEKVFFSKTHVTLQNGGILVFIVPHYSLDKELSNWISKNYENVKVFRAPEQRFKQVVVFGVRRIQGRIDFEIRDKLMDANENYSLLSELPENWDDDSYLVPEVTASRKEQFRSVKIDSKQLGAELSNNSGLWSQFGSIFTTETENSSRPLCNLSKWHLAISLAAGDVSGLVVSKSGRKLLIKGDTHKEKQDKVETNVDEESGGVVVIKTRTDQFVPVIRAIDMTENTPKYGQIIVIK